MKNGIQPNHASNGVLSANAIEIMRQRSRIIQLLDVAERVGIAPLRSGRLHAFAYLADVLSPVWDLPAFDGKVLKIEGGPHYPILQRELDRLVPMGIVEITNISYIPRPEGGARIDGFYALNLKFPNLDAILLALGSRGSEHALDSRDAEVYGFLLELAGALAKVPDDEIDRAATLDATYADNRIDLLNVIDFGDWTTEAQTDNLSLRTVSEFHKFLPRGALLQSGEKLYLYASFLGRRVDAG